MLDVLLSASFLMVCQRKKGLALSPGPSESSGERDCKSFSWRVRRCAAVDVRGAVKICLHASPSP